LIEKKNGEIVSIDWEYGSLNGFPGTDIAFYLLQTAALIFHWPPSKSRIYARLFLANLKELNFNIQEADAVVCLTAYDAYLKSLADGHLPSEPLLRWRQQLWEG
jgi:hypothetical protein